MFFDEIKKCDTDSVYSEMLIKIAKKQRELFGCRFNWDTRKIHIEPEKKTLFRKEKPSLYQNLLYELEYLKQQVVKYREEKGYSHGIFWWNLPWEQIEQYLFDDLVEEQEKEGNWRVAYHWKTVEKNGLYVLVLHEEGHCSDFSKSEYHSYKEESKYSSAERSEMVRDFNRQVTKYELFSLALSDDRPVHSLITGTDYASEADYLLSAEHFITRDYLSSRYERSLYTPHVSHEVYAVSNSRHYESIYVVADYHLRFDGTLDYLGVRNYELIEKKGDCQEGIMESCLTKDAAIACAAYMAMQKEVKKVPLELFGKDIIAGAVNYAKAMRQAEIYTCLADKIGS